MARRRLNGLGLLGAGAVAIMLYGIAELVIATQTSDIQMQRAFAQLFALGTGIGGLAMLAWVIREIRRWDKPTRRVAYQDFGVGLAVAAVLIGWWTYYSFRTYSHEERARAATESWREDFEDDLVDSFWGWSADRGESQRFYTGDSYEHWSFDPDGDGHVDQDAPILRTLDRAGWAGRGVAVIDLDGDLLTDYLEWTNGPVSWCVPVRRHPETRIIGARWSDAVPERCENDGP